MNTNTKNAWRVEQQLLVVFQRIAHMTQGTAAHAEYVEKIKETKHRIQYLAQQLQDEIVAEQKEAAYHGTTIEYVN